MPFIIIKDCSTSEPCAETSGLKGKERLHENHSWDCVDIWEKGTNQIWLRRWNDHFILEEKKNWECGRSKRWAIREAAWRHFGEQKKSGAAKDSNTFFFGHISNVLKECPPSKGHSNNLRLWDIPIVCVGMMRDGNKRDLNLHLRELWRRKEKKRNVGELQRGVRPQASLKISQRTS